MAQAANNAGLQWLASQLVWERRLTQLQETADLAHAIGEDLPVVYGAELAPAARETEPVAA